LEVIANLEPVESLMTVALTPRLAPELVVALLMALARSFKLSPVVLLPIWKVTESPEAVVSANDDVGSVAVALDSRSEYQPAVVARLFTTTVWVPAVVPFVAVAVT
jgi:hypothetical protein